MVSDWDIKRNDPEEKDIERARGMSRIRGDYKGGPKTTNASKMAKLIKDEIKMIRRAKAIAAIWGTGNHTTEDKEGNEVEENVWDPFVERMTEMGFTASQVNKISKFKIDNPWIAAGLDDIF